jgi:uncharacterized membrane protein
MSDQMAVLIASYPSQQLAEDDWGTLRDLDREKALHFDDAAVVVKNPQGHIGVVKDLHHPVRKGALVGGVLGLLFPPSIIVGLVGGAVVGRITELFHHGISRGDMKDMGDFVDANSALLVVVSNPETVDAVKSTLKEATGFMEKVIDADGKEVLAAADDA